MLNPAKNRKRERLKYIHNIFKEGELQEQAVVRNFRTTAADGKSYEVYHYNLDVIISVGYRVKSRRGTQFRIWANDILKQYLIQGYALNEQKLQAQQERLADLKQAIALVFWNVTRICITRKVKNALPIMHSWRLPC